MIFRFLKPFDDVCGIDSVDVEVEENDTLKDAIKRLEKKIPALAQYITFESYELLSFRIVFTRGDQSLRLEDRIEKKDTIQVLPPISGG